MDMGLDPDSKAKLTIRGTVIEIDKIIVGSTPFPSTCQGRFAELRFPLPASRGRGSDRIVRRSFSRQRRARRGNAK